MMVRRDGGSALFIQPRVGLNGRVFKCYKLRTMAVNAEARLKEMCDSDPEIAREWHENQKLAVDPRITKIGAFLRKTSLDELPQLINIFKGDMSLVGPRPFLPDQQAFYTEAGGRAYFSMRPGVTGLWQVEGRGTTRFVDRAHYDETYYAKASLSADISLLMRTVGVVFKMTGH
jgi:exopolysaccharide production protein ExoY